MKTKTIISELTQEDLVNLLCTATYGSNWLDCTAPNRKGIVVDDTDCREDVWAKALLAGNKIKCLDYYAEGVTYGNLVCGIEDKEDNEAAYYWVGLQDIINGLQKCADGTFAESEEYGEWISKCFRNFQNGGYDMDNPEAEALMQIILFGELIYG